MLCDKHFTRYERRTASNKSGLTLIELMLSLILFATIASGIILILNKGMEIFFFEREEVLVQSNIRNVMDKISNDLKKASSVDLATQTDISFNGSSKRYYLNGEKIYNVDGEQVNSSEVKVVDLSFSYYGNDFDTPLSFPVDTSQVKAVEIEIQFQKGDNPTLELKSWVLMRNLI